MGRVQEEKKKKKEENKSLKFISGLPTLAAMPNFFINQKGRRFEGALDHPTVKPSGGLRPRHYDQDYSRLLTSCQQTEIEHTNRICQV